MHLSITRAAYEALQPWQQELWAAQRDTLIREYSLIPDHAGLPERKAELGRYVRLPNGEMFEHKPREREYNYYLTKHYFDKAIELVRAGDLDEAAKYTGCLLHFIEDAASPAHTMPGDNQLGLLKDLIPTPAGYQNRPLHGLVEQGDAELDLTGYRPTLLGTSSAESVFNLIEELNPIVRNSRAQLIPILQGIYRGSEQDVQEGRRRAALMSAKVAADVLHSILSVAKERYDEEEVGRLRARDLSSLTPLQVVNQSYFPQYTYFNDPYFGYPVVNGILEEGKTMRRLELSVVQEGQIRTASFDRGLGLGTHSLLTYALPENVYDRFECLVGLHKRLGEKGKVVFRFYADGEAVFYSGLMTEDDPAQRVNLDIWGVRQLSISVETRSDRRGHNYAVVAQPILIKAEKPHRQQVH